MCGHANESPVNCDCGPDCYCRVYGCCRKIREGIPITDDSCSIYAYNITQLPPNYTISRAYAVRPWPIKVGPPEYGTKYFTHEKQARIYGKGRMRVPSSYYTAPDADPEMVSIITLPNGEVYVLARDCPIKLDDCTQDKLRKAALDKLTPEDKAALGLKDVI
jgi:hypothetical protein